MFYIKFAKVWIRATDLLVTEATALPNEPQPLPKNNHLEFGSDIVATNKHYLCSLSWLRPNHTSWKFCYGMQQTTAYQLTLVRYFLFLQNCIGLLCFHNGLGSIWISIYKVSRNIPLGTPLDTFINVIQL